MSEATARAELARRFLSYVMYKPTECNTIRPHTTFDSTNLPTKDNYLDEDGEFFRERYTNRYVALKSPTGMGKTEAATNYIKSTGKRIISIVHQITVGQKHVQDFRAQGLQCHWHEDVSKDERAPGIFPYSQA